MLLLISNYKYLVSTAGFLKGIFDKLNNNGGVIMD